jgi:O-acetyl-ADP-ribose deacetylase
MNRVVHEIALPGDVVLQIVEGDLTTETVDAIVNAANQHLQHGGGVAGAISRRGGRLIQAESDEWVRQHGLATHDRPAYTIGGNLPCRYVIHAVGPVWGSGNEDAKLAAALTGSLRLAGELGLATIAFPAISSGIFGFPKDRAARVILEAIRDDFTKNPHPTLRLVRITLIDQPTLQAFLDACRLVFSES